ncbi:MAG: exodeoxyribonuclease VII small subunit [Planctomycetes bacterium]|nr:exodeoxyribonuclease VII small subunit [Planctomycetota bacterium]
MAKKKPTPRDECVASFEESLEELEKIVAELEGGKLGLSDALARYEQGVKHLKSCQQLLERAERKIELLSGVDADGNPIAQPFEEVEVESLEAKAAARGQRRTTVTKASTVRVTMRDNDIDDPGRLF